jgi:hypothetical protein
MDLAKKERKLGHCTGCGKELPQSRLGWGLIWEDGTGLCAKCLYHIRKATGYFERTTKTYAPKTRITLKKQKEEATKRRLEKEKNENLPE